MTVQTVKILSELVNTPVEKLLAQMKDAGLPHSSADQEVSDVEKQILLNYLNANMVMTEGGEQRITFNVVLGAIAAMAQVRQLMLR